MGHYTGLQVRAKLKPEFVAPIQRLRAINHSRPDSIEPDSVWLELAKEYPAFPGIQTWGAFHRANFIPFGWVASSPLEDNDPKWRWKLTAKDGVWQFQCGLKNYENEIDQFAELVLRHIVDGEPEVCRAISEDGGEWNPFKETLRQAHRSQLWHDYYGE